MAGAGKLGRCKLGLGKLSWGKLGRDLAYCHCWKL